MPPVVGAYAVLQLVAMVVLLVYLQRAEFPYAFGVACWAFMVGTMVLTAWWLEGRRDLLGWESLRMLAVGAAIALGETHGSYGEMSAAAAYGVLSLIGVLAMRNSAVNQGEAREYS